MLPSNIKQFLSNVLEETRNGRVTWSYDSENDEVKTNFNGMPIVIDYRFDYNTSSAYHRISIHQNGKHFFFAESQYDNDYDLLRIVYSEAQASDFHF